MVGLKVSLAQSSHLFELLRVFPGAHTTKFLQQLQMVPSYFSKGDVDVCHDIYQDQHF